MSHTAFFYGTLMAPPVLHRVIWGQSSPPTPTHATLLTIRPAILHAHRRHKVRGADYPAILPASSDTSRSPSVRGTLVTGLTDGDIWRLDIFEGSDYSRRKVRVRVLEGEGGDMGDFNRAESANVEGEEVEAESYVWTADKEALEDGEWDFATFVREKMRFWAGREAQDVDEGFQDVDDAVAGLSDSDPTGGRGQGGHITKALEEEEKARKAKEILESAV